MVDIPHRIGVESSTPEKVYEAITTLEGLSGWWAENTTGDAGLGGVIDFRFRVGGFSMQVTKLDPGRLVRWDVVEGPAEWVGTSVQWDLRPDGDYTIVLFRHEGWREPVEFMHHCSTKWATFLMSLKQLLETGTGAPDPRDQKISDLH
jgi:uncharacterized protein YndB with AHSA1/START domain